MSSRFFHFKAWRNQDESKRNQIHRCQRSHASWYHLVSAVYELIAKGHFEIVEVLGKRRITKESFERWYASQRDYRTVEDQALDADIISVTYGLPEIARMLGTHRQNIYAVAAKGHFELVRVGRHNRATKESFEKWYQNQNRYRLVTENGLERS